MAVERKDFGQLSDGSKVSLYTITNARGESVSLTDYGASVVSLLVHDRQGALQDIVLGCDDAPAYERQTACLGGVPGRHANRIARGRFVLNGKTYQLAINNGENHLHGGQRRGGHQLIEAVLFIVGEAVDGQHEADDSHEGAHAGRPVPDAGKDGDHQHNIHDKKFSLSADEGQILIYQAFHDRPPFFFLV